MPPKKSKHVVAQMEAKVDALESELAEVRSSLAAVTTAVKDLTTTLVAILERSLGKSIQLEDASVNREKGERSEEKTPYLFVEKSG